MMHAPTEPADLATLARRRRIAHLLAAALLITMIVALMFGPNNDNDRNAASLITGLSAILLLAAGAAGVHYTVRMDRRRRRSKAPRAVTTTERKVPAGSAARTPILQLRSAHQLLESALPDIEPVRRGIGAAAEQTRASLEQTGRRVVLQEKVLRTLSESVDSDRKRIDQTRRNLETMTDRLQSGVDLYVNLAQQATLTAISLGALTAGDSLQDAADQLAGLAEGMQQVQQISADRS